jgi:hypothetical protein
MHAAASSDKNNKGTASGACNATSKAAAKSDAHSADVGLVPSIGVQGMRVFSSLKVAGWSLAGGGGARSAHATKSDRDAPSKDKTGVQWTAIPNMTSHCFSY